MRFSCVGLRGIGFFGAAVTAAFVFAGCSEDPGMQERVNRLQAEMQEKDRQIQDAQSSLEKTKSELKAARAASANSSTSTSKPPTTDTPASSSAPSFLPKEQLEDSYGAASKTMQKRLASELRNYTVENCAEFPVVMPSDEYPYHSKVVVTFRSDGGRSYRLEFPVSADAKGSWSFPSSSDVTGALADSRSMDTSNVASSTPANNPTPAATPRVAQNNATPAPTSRPSSSNTSSVVPGQTANETHVIDWGDGRNKGNNPPSNNPPDRSPTPARVNNPPANNPTPAGNATPVPVMQSDKDVKIHW